MRKSGLFCVLVVLFFFCSAAGAETVVNIRKGLADGNQFNKSSEALQLSYVAGILDGIKMAPLLGGSEELTGAFADCLVGLSVNQAMGIVLKEHHAHPEWWDTPMHLTVYRAILNACENFRETAEAQK
ncbi:MAG: hypothetical protein H8E41_08095 [Desulfobulbaceae bacterium]|uniref:Rap1a immunity protein domain-containing protein n=1 Tax=Candidatus Desulfobia pelagia TaxID=2841692 RepID=A0A8J6TFV7_9BACT|nr:hypothetical protein [Candidatus Desulfobia pelagia]